MAASDSGLTHVLQTYPLRIQNFQNPYNLRERFHDSIKDMPGLLIVILLDGQLPSRVIMRVRNHKDLQLLPVPLITPVRDPPPLLPRAAIIVPELDPIIKLLRRDVKGRGGEGVIEAPLLDRAGTVGPCRC